MTERTPEGWEADLHPREGWQDELEQPEGWERDLASTPRRPPKGRAPASATIGAMVDQLLDRLEGRP